MLIYKDKSKFDAYVDGLERAINDGASWENYMNTNVFPVFCFDDKTVIYNQQLSLPFYSEIPIDSITSCNVSNGIEDYKIYSNIWMIIKAIPYILKGHCKPIAVIKHSGGYYIENGKHRFCAHVILKKKTIPVSIREIIDTEDRVENENMVTINRPFYNDDGMDIAYPEKAIEFFNTFKHFYENDLRKCFSKLISSVEMDETHLTLEFYNGDTIVFSGCLNKCDIFYILSECGYQITMKYVKENNCFKLTHKRSALTISFKSEPLLNVIEKIIIPNIQSTEKKAMDEIDISDLTYLISKHLHSKGVIQFNLISYVSQYLSHIIKVNNIYYYLIAFENDTINNIFIFEDINNPFNNTTINHIGTLNPNDDCYNKIMDAFKNNYFHSLNI